MKYWQWDSHSDSKEFQYIAKTRAWHTATEITASRTDRWTRDEAGRDTTLQHRDKNRQTSAAFIIYSNTKTKSISSEINKHTKHLNTGCFQPVDTHGRVRGTVTRDLVFFIFSLSWEHFNHNSMKQNSGESEARLSQGPPCETSDWTHWHL